MSLDIEVIEEILIKVDNEGPVHDPTVELDSATASAVCLVLTARACEIPPPSCIHNA